MPPRLPPLAVVAAALLLPGAPGLAGVEIEVASMPETVVCGEPVPLKLILRNDTPADLTVPGLWAWNETLATRWLSPVLVLERRGERGWLPVEALHRRFARPWGYDQFWPAGLPRVELRPGDRYYWWWDVLWFARLGPGLYRFRAAIPLSPPGVEPAVTRAVSSSEFRVLSPEGKSLQLWESTTTQRQDWRGDGNYWLVLLQNKDVTDTRYEIWYAYNELLTFVMTGHWMHPVESFVRLPRSLAILARVREANPGFPFWDRVDLVRRCFEHLPDYTPQVLTTLDPIPPYPPGPSSDDVAAVLGILRQSDDLEWVDHLLHHLASELAFRERLAHGEEGRKHSEFLADWGYPWYVHGPPPEAP